MDKEKFDRLVEEASHVLEIDKFRLDEEWVKQPKIYQRFSDGLADARKDWEEAKLEASLKKADLEEQDAELDLDIRRQPAKYNLEGKLTEPMIAKCVLIQKEHRSAYRDWLDAKREVIKTKHLVDVLEGIVKALDQKKYGLPDMVSLDGRSYFSNPKMRTKAKEEAANRAFKHPSKGGKE